MSHVKSGGKISDKGNVSGKRLGTKLFGGQKVAVGQVIVRQTGSTKIAGDGTFMSKNFTIHAAKDGIVAFQKVKKSRFTGKTASRTQVLVK